MIASPGLLRSIGIWLVAICAAGGIVAGCSSRVDSRTTTEIELRTDPEPLMEWFPLIGTPERVTWVYSDRANEGDDRLTIPGPSQFYVHAIVELGAAEAELIRSEYTPSELAVPDVRTGLRKLVPPGLYETGPELNRAISGDEWIGAAYLIRDGRVLIVTATENAFAPDDSADGTNAVPPTK